jgi:SAM-dependent methyltransferase
VIRALHSSFALNRRACCKLERFLPQCRKDIFREYERTVAKLIDELPARAMVLDVGGGKSCPFAKHPNGTDKSTIVAVDISEEEIKYNHDVSGKVVADMVNGPPFRPSSVGLITSRSVLEHMTDVRRFTSGSRQILKPGAYFVHLFPAKFAVFALVNILLPNRASKALVHFFHPASRGLCGFPAVYDKCYYSAIQRLLVENGFESIRIEVSYYQSRYVDFCMPLFLAGSVYEVLLKFLGLKNLAAHLLVIARKPAIEHSTT